MSDPTVQAPAGPPADASGTWQVSLAEVDAMGRKAARGAGLSWGLAEEAGRAARWLAAFGLPGPQALLAALLEMDGNLDAHAPDANFRAGKPLCPIRTGAGISDMAATLEGLIRLDAVIEPILIVPFLSRTARDLELEFVLAWAGGRASAAPNGPACADWTALRGCCTHLSVVVGQSFDERPLRAGAGPWPVSVECWRQLERLAQRTYVPATEASRAGAGAGTRDND